MEEALSRPVCDDDPTEIDRIWRLNQANTPELGGITLAEMTSFATSADWFGVIDEEDGPAAFLIALSPSAPYDSPNFLWFRDRYDEFLYVDRVAVDQRARRKGYGRALYRQLFAHGRSLSVPRVTCEVNLEPPNEGSLLFHEQLGFTRVGEQVARSKRVALLCCQLNDVHESGVSRE